MKLKSGRLNASTDANAGYTPDGNVTAITMLHESGTGGAPKYGLIPQVGTSLEYRTSFADPLNLDATD